ncbi:aminodeoxychorismate lyase [Colwellia sp. E2M01]|uniref:aminodeoxychorismate lyase n=1 Tax=Colwellia sp. E2M01 TaxID=2841561 RepID=UPI001C0935DB|nr:aminodeoxychorismate lyase [Colwellia sp. E2M01]MBU2870451.1 aminodeoxychorismate lyase [Colwellia sp. E2M01]
MKFCSINGQQQTKIAINDRGLSYGDGLFTTAKIAAGKVMLLAKHVERLIDGCQKLKIPLPDDVNLTQELSQVAQPYASAVLKVMITAGSGGRGYSRLGLKDNATNIIITVTDFPTNYAEIARTGINMGNSEQQLASSSMLGGIKHLNRLEQVLLKAEVDERSEDDLIVTNVLGNVVEAISSNVFYWLDGQLYTPEISTSGVNGIIRQVIIEKNPQINIVKTKLSELKQVQSMFICNALMGIIPVKTYNEQQLNLTPVIMLQQEMKGLL